MITPHLDIFAVFIFLGAMQGIYLFLFFVTRKEGNLLSNRLLGFLLLSLSLIIFDIFAGYSGYFIYFIEWNNASEPLNFVMGPLVYLYITSVLIKQEKPRFKDYLHFIPASFWLLYMVTYFIQNPVLKYNDFLGAYHPDIPGLPVNIFIDFDSLGIRQFVNQITIIHIFIYAIFALYQIRDKAKKQNVPFFSYNNKAFVFLRLIAFGALLAVILILTVKLIFNADLGDYIIASFTGMLIYSMSFYIIKESNFFTNQFTIETKKYEKSALTPEMQKSIKNRLDSVMKKEKPYLDNSLSLSGLAKKISISPHYLSQILNESFQKNFFEYIADYRIESAKELLRNDAYSNMVIEEIAERVGYNSKSAFNTAFKKLTGMTPSEYRKKNDLNS